MIDVSDLTKPADMMHSCLWTPWFWAYKEYKDDYGNEYIILDFKEV